MSRFAKRSLLLAAVVLTLSLLPAHAQTSLVATGWVWRYFDQGSEPSGWRSLLFDDSGWATGPGQLGFGDGDEAKEISRTNSAGATNIAFYFRRTFSVPDPSVFTNLMVRLRRDDGVIVYLNEQEVYRNNMPPGLVNSNTLALMAVADDGNGIFAGPVSVARLNAGDNQLAVEIHQAALTSTDISFDLELLGNATFQPPTVSLLAPIHGTTLGTMNLTLIAGASDNDGTVTTVDFYDGATWIGVATNAPFTLSWTGVAPGPHLLTAVALDNTGLSATSAPASILILPALIPRGAGWKYLDSGPSAGTAWKDPGFNDSGWSNGVAQLGYGDGDEATLISFGPDSTSKFITTYFRRDFDVPDPAAISNLVVRLLRDDGAIVYLNGTEVFRNNMPTGAVTFATTAVIPIEDEQFHGARITHGLLLPGANVLGVEIHQASVTSSDVSFDLELLPNVTPTRPIVRLTAPANNATFFGPTNLTLTADTSDVDSPVPSVIFLDGPTALGTSTVNVVGDASLAHLFNPGPHTLRAVAIDTMGLSATSAPVNIAVIPAPILTTLVATGSVWRFLDTNSAPAAGWRTASFDDSAWRSGPGILGYGQLGSTTLFTTPRTLINIGPMGSRQITAYFRHVFQATNVAGITNLAFRVLRDDGVVVHLNGTEIFRMNMPAGEIFYITQSPAAVSGTNEFFYFPTEVVPGPGLILEGRNILAVELHQDLPTTSDAGFDLGLVATSPPPGSQPTLHLRYDGVTVILTWDVAGFVLQEAGSPEGPYAPSSSSVSPVLITPTLPVRFFRLSQP